MTRPFAYSCDQCERPAISGSSDCRGSRARREDEDVIIDDADHPAVEGGVYVIAYGEMVDGYRHAYRVTREVGSGVPGLTPRHTRSWVRYSRDFGHPPDPRCPECAD